MKNDSTSISRLLEKFFDAETSEQEENVLKEYFKGEVAEEHKIYLPLFEFYQTGFDDGRELSNDFDSKFFDKVNSQKLSAKRNASYYLLRYSGVAAILLIAFGFYFFNKSSEDYNPIDEEHAINALILISEKMDLASNQLHSLGAIEKSFNSFDAFKALETYSKQINNK